MILISALLIRRTYDLFRLNADSSAVSIASSPYRTTPTNKKFGSLVSTFAAMVTLSTLYHQVRKVTAKAKQKLSIPAECRDNYDEPQCAFIVASVLGLR